MHLIKRLKLLPIHPHHGTHYELIWRITKLVTGYYSGMREHSNRWKLIYLEASYPNEMAGGNPNSEVKIYLNEYDCLVNFVPV